MDAGAVTRSEHFWMRRDRAEPMLSAITTGDSSALQHSYAKLWETFAEAQRKVDEWRTPREVFAVLQKAGIIGIGGPAGAVAELQANLAAERAAAGWEEPGDDDYFDYIAGGIRSGLSASMSLLSLVKKIQAALSREISSTGFIFNDCRRDLSVACDHQVPTASSDPYFFNSYQTLGPSQMVIPARGMVLDPMTDREHDCVAMCPWGSENVNGMDGTFVSMTIKHPIFKNVGVGWGIPYDQPVRTILHELGGNAMSARAFFEDWHQGRIGAPRSHWRTDAGASLVVDNRDGRIRIGQVGVVFFDMPPRH